MSRIEMINPDAGSSWDELSRGHPLGLICHTSDWQRFLEGCFSHIRCCSLALIGDDGKIRSGLPLYEVRSPFIGRRLVSVPFASLSDPLLADPNDFSALVGAAIEQLRNIGGAFLEIRTFNAAPIIEDARLAVSRYYLTHSLQLGGRPENLMRRFDRTCVRQRISRAQRSGLNIVRVEDEKTLRRFQNLNFITRKRLGLPPQPFRILESFWKIFSPAGRADFLLAEKDGLALAGLMVFKYKDRVSAEISVSDSERQAFSPSHLLFWEAIRNACADGYSVFDFGRTVPDNITLMNFKGRWGTETAELPHYYYPREVSKAVTQRERSPAYRIIRKICRRAPDPVLARLGDFIYGHLG